MTGAVRPLNILHVLRAPVGGLFRHVVDLARGQAARGHRVGLVADATTGGARAEATLAELAPPSRSASPASPMSRQIGPRDVAAIAHVAHRAAEMAADVLHGHGAKGGAYAGSPAPRARSASTRRTAAACTTAGHRRPALLYLAPSAR